MLYIVEKIIIAIADSVDIEMIKTIVSVVVYILTRYLSIFIAGCVLGVTIWQGLQNRKHNRLSVRPLLMSLLSNKIEGGIRYYEVTLVNHGVGPAIIKDFILKFNGEKVSINDAKTYKDFLDKKMKKFKKTRTGHRTKNAIIKIGEELTLWKFECDKDEDIEDIKKLKIRIEYQSIYRDEIFFHPPKK